MGDRLSFVFGLFVIIFGEYLILCQPHMFTYFYTFLLIVLVSKRYPEFKAEKCELFMLDLCYAVNLSTLAQLHLAPASESWFLTNYSLSLGSLGLALVVWQNSLVLHNISKLTSLLLHALAPITLHLVRWRVIPSDLELPDQGLRLHDAILLPILFYSLWQILYLLLTEVILASYIKSDKEIVFALRALASDSDNGMHQLVLSIMRRLGVMEETEQFDADTIKSKLIFVTAQLVYTLATLAPVPLLYNSFRLSNLYLGLLLGWTVLRGAESYFQDFVDRYKLEEKKLE